MDQPEQDSRSRPNSTEIHTEGGAAVGGSVTVEGGDFVGRDKIIQIGALQIPFALAVVLGASTLIVAVSLAWVAIRLDAGRNAEAQSQADVTAVPARMDKPFNIAVAQFAAIGPSGVITGSEDGALLSKWVYDELKQIYSDREDGISADVLIWHDSEDLPGKTVVLGPILGDDVEARRRAAAQLSQAISATMVIYGVLDPNSNPANLEMEFHVTPDLQRVVELRQITTAVVGRYALGSPLPVVLPLGNALNNADAQEKLSKRSALLFWLTVGLTQDALGNFGAALDQFHAADAYLEREHEEGGRDLVQLMIGQQHLWLDQLEEAETAFQRALSFNPQYARAQIGLGGVHYRRAQAAREIEELETELSADGQLGQARSLYREAAEQARAGGDRLVASIAELALASTLRLEGEFSYVVNFDSQELAHAEQRLASAIETATPLLEPLAEFRDYRLLAQAYVILGAAHFQLSDIARIQELPDQRRAHLLGAQEAFTQCLEQRDRIPVDKVIADKIAGEMCRPFLERIQEVLQEMEGTP